jgi:hypothetical protein
LVVPAVVEVEGDLRARRHSQDWWDGCGPFQMFGMGVDVERVSHCLVLSSFGLNEFIFIEWHGQ